jgi:hypothetical protein
MTPDGASVLCGGADGRVSETLMLCVGERAAQVHVFDSKTGAPVAALGSHEGPIGAVRYVRCCCWCVVCECAVCT